MPKRYNSVLDMLADDSDDGLREEVEQQISQRQIIKKLLANRAALGMSQKDVAAKMGCSQSRVSKLENGQDNDLRMGDFRDYLNALDLDVRLLICKQEWQSFERIKFHALQIRECLENLVVIAGDDPDIETGVSHAHMETLFNLITLVVDSAQKLPSFPQILPDIIEADCSDNHSDYSSGSSDYSLPGNSPTST